MSGSRSCPSASTHQGVSRSTSTSFGPISWNRCSTIRVGSPSGPVPSARATSSAERTCQSSAGAGRGAPVGVARVGEESRFGMGVSSAA